MQILKGYVFMNVKVPGLDYQNGLIKRSLLLLKTLVHQTVLIEVSNHLPFGYNSGVICLPKQLFKKSKISKSYQI